MTEFTQMPLCPLKNGVGCLPGPRPDGTCCSVTPPAPVDSFSVSFRDVGHWDISTIAGRAFAIRGGPGAVYVRDERKMPGLPDHPRVSRQFRSLGAAMAWCIDELIIPVPA